MSGGDDRPALHELLGLRPTDDPHRWRQMVGTAVATTTGALQGGAAFAGAVEAAVGAPGRPLRGATAQFISHVQPGSVVDIDISVPVDGHHLSQARAVMHCEGNEILTMLAALGERPLPFGGVWPVPPDVPAPEACPERVVPGKPGPSILQTFDRRSAIGRSYTEVDGHPGPGRSASWFRLPGGRRMVGAGDLAVIGDFLMVRIRRRAGRAVHGRQPRQHAAGRGPGRDGVGAARCIRPFGLGRARLRDSTPVVPDGWPARDNVADPRHPGPHPRGRAPGTAGEAGVGN